jgi:hypothetical protein
MAKTEARPTSESDPHWPKPWTKPEDREGWEVVLRAKDRKGKPAVGTALFVELTQDQARWIMQVSDDAGVTMVDYVKRLIDEARSAPPDGSK